MKELFVIFLCLLINALLAAFETAFVSVSRAEVRRLARGGDKNAEQLLSLRDSPERALSIIQVGITLVSAASSAVGGAAAVDSIKPFFATTYRLSPAVAEWLALVAVVLPITYFSVVIGELVPKSLALRSPLRISLRGTRWLLLADRLISPAVSMLERSTKSLLRFRVFRGEREPELPETTLEIGGLPPIHQRAVLNLAQIERQRVKDVMIPWPCVVSIRSLDPMEEIASVVFSSGHTRLPVLENEAVIGVLHTKEFLALRELRNRDWRQVVRPALTVSPDDSLLSTLRLLQTNRQHMTVVRGEGGTPMGIVTLEDIVQEVWGEVYDEDEDSRIRQLFSERAKTKPRPPRAS